ncbi:hypothetical protein CL622_07370 [archaeon]|nr:hypothetical protein [archaeon]|tara:strand:+ start:267 stop:485 length:219 start_codon:yes stop_codon:yes gene_type:complete
MASLRKLGLTYYVRYRLNGKQVSEKIGRNISKKVAKEMLQRVEERLARIKQDEQDKKLGIDYKKMYLNLIEV